VTEPSPPWQSYVSHIRETAERSSDELVRAELFQIASLYEKLQRIVGKTSVPPDDDAARAAAVDLARVRAPEFRFKDTARGGDAAASAAGEAGAADTPPRKSSVEAGSLLAYLVLMNQQRG